MKHIRLIYKLSSLLVVYSELSNDDDIVLVFRRKQEKRERSEPLRSLFHLLKYKFDSCHLDTAANPWYTRHRNLGEGNIY